MLDVYPPADKAMKRNEVRDAIVVLLDQAGIAHQLVRGGRHDRLVFEYAGRTHKVIMPNTSSCRHAAANARGFVRRLLRT
jgi:hypothetical protein